jgi:hypothetical protein
MEDYTAKIKARNGLALITFIVSKVFGMAALVSFFINDTAGFFMLALYGLMLMITVAICIVNMRAFNKQEVSEKDILQRLKDEGVLGSYLKQIGYR